jgi:hypothetical protein
MWSQVIINEPKKLARIANATEENSKEERRS